LVVFAIDHKDDVTSGDGDNIALKFMKNRDQFLKEVNTRTDGGFDERFVLPITCIYDGDDDQPRARAFREDAALMGYEDYKYCVVMEAASRSLLHAIDHDQFVGNDWDLIKGMIKQLASGLDHIHSKGIVHGDVKRTCT
jgi:serine/threonine protein kinase